MLSHVEICWSAVQCGKLCDVKQEPKDQQEVQDALLPSSFKERLRGDLITKPPGEAVTSTGEVTASFGSC